MPRDWSRRTFLASTAATLAATTMRAQASTPKMIYVGSTSKGEGAGIHTGMWNADSGTLSNFRLVFEVKAAGFLAGSNAAGKRLLFAGHQSAPKVGAVSSFHIEPSGDLQLINTITVPEFDMVHTAIDHTQRCLITASYGTGKVLSVTIAADGHLSSPVSQIQLSGHGPNAARQTAPHAHGVAVSPDNRFVLINDLGTDRIMVYKLNAATAELTPNDPAFFAAAPGSGPRHLVFHSNGRWAYSINELDSTITQLNWNAATGVLNLATTTPTLPPGGDVASNRAGELVFDKTGKFLYACNRGGTNEELLVFHVGADGHLTLGTRVPVDGKEARHFALSPNGRWMLVAIMFSNRLAVFSRNSETGDLHPTENIYPVSEPSCVLFA